MSNARYSITQARAVKDKRITHAQFRTLAALGMYSDEDGWCFPSQTTIGDDLGKGRQTVNEDIAALVELGYLQKYGRVDENGAQTSNMYRLIFDTPIPTPPVGTDGHPLSEPADTNVPNERPKLTKEELQEVIQSANKAVDKFLEINTPPANYWKGREFFHDGHYRYADWYHGVTNQVCQKRYQRSWQKAFSEWQDAELDIDSLQKAYDEDVKWKKFITDPNELTKKAIAIKAASARQPSLRPVETDDNGAPISY